MGPQQRLQQGPHLLPEKRILQNPRLLRKGKEGLGLLCPQAQAYQNGHQEVQPMRRYVQSQGSLLQRLQGRIQPDGLLRLGLSDENQRCLQAELPEQGQRIRFQEGTRRLQTPVRQQECQSLQQMQGLRQNLPPWSPERQGRS